MHKNATTSLTSTDNRIRNLGREYVGKTVSSAIWETAIHAIANHTVVEAEYTNRENEAGKGLIAPLSVWFAEGRAYLLAVDLETDVIKVWRLDRFTAMCPAPSKQAPQIAEEEIEQAMRQSFKGYVATPEQITLLVSAGRLSFANSNTTKASYCRNSPTGT